MKEYSFQATGTVWTIIVDTDCVSEDHFIHLREYSLAFERIYSRFIETSMIGDINSRQSNAITSQRYEISEELLKLLNFGAELKELTHGYFDINVGSILEGYGYDKTYSFTENVEVRLKTRGNWKIDDQVLICEGLVSLDLGAYGKGYLIGLLAEELRKRGYEHFLIDGGRDFWGSTKRSGEAWVIALEHPHDEKLAIGEYLIKNSALACSGTMHRKRGDFHHLINPMDHAPSQLVEAVFVSHSDPMIADGVSTALFVTPKQKYAQLLSSYKPEYCIVFSDGSIEKSSSFVLFE